MMCVYIVLVYFHQLMYLFYRNNKTLSAEIIRIPIPKSTNIQIQNVQFTNYKKYYLIVSFMRKSASQIISMNTSCSPAVFQAILFLLSLMCVQ